MSDNAHFSVHTRLTRLLGETYRSSEVALKELVDNAWDADAQNVWITLPTPVTNEAVIVRDDGMGMTAREMLGEYLNIASDKRTRTGDRTPKFHRKVKGRKGIGKFAGLMIAGRMEVSTVARGRRCSLLIDKVALIENQNDLETIPLPFTEGAADDSEGGTRITLLDLNRRLNFPTPSRLREVLIHEYGREDGFKVIVDDVPLSVHDVPGKTTEASTTLPTAGKVSLKFTVASGKRPPKSPGIILKVGGKAVGRPMLFGLDQDEEIPPKLAGRVYGEVDLTGLEDDVTADWGGVIENSKAFQEAQTYIKAAVKEELQATHAREMILQMARLQKQINQRLRQLPEHRRQYAREALDRILKRFYGESEERRATIVDVALDAMEYDAYWAVLERINASSQGDVGSFAEALEQFGLVELSTIGVQAKHRLQFLEYLDQLIQKPETLEKDAHKALETNLWVLGRHYSTMSSNATLRTIIGNYCETNYKGSRAAKRPDLLLAQDYGDTYLLIEFKRPSHSITRDDIAQAEKYRDDLSSRLSSTTKMDIMMLGKGRAITLDTNNLLRTITIHSYASIISAGRNELDWLISSLTH
jgi:Histidine kinase-, DNA gyrase B-, and HSP90-like ATPase